MPTPKLKTVQRQADLPELILFINNHIRELNYLLENLDSDNLGRIDSLLMKSVALTSTTPAGKDGEIRWGVSSLGSGPHVWKSGVWNYSNTTPVP